MSETHIASPVAAAGEAAGSSGAKGSPPPPAPAAGGERQFQVPVGTDDRGAVPALTGLLFGDDEAEPQNSGDEPDAEPGENPAIGSEDGAAEPPATRAAIEAPNSWSAEDKAVFSKLPPEAQAVIARRESERDRLIQGRTQEIANERKGWDAEREAIQTQRNQYLQSLQQLTALAVPEAKQFEGIDWQRLANENPAEYVRLSGVRDAVLGRIGAIQAEAQRAMQASQTDQAKRIEGVIASERAKLHEQVPEFADAEKGPKLIGEMRGFLRDAYGFSDAEIGSVVDHRLVRLGYDLMRLRQADQARSAALQKRQNTAPQVQRPGAVEREDNRDGKMRGLVGRLGETNSLRDAGRLLSEIL